MKVYIVTDGDYSDYRIEAVFVDREKALKYQAQKQCDYIEEYVTEDDLVDDGIKYKISHRAYFYKSPQEVTCRAVLDKGQKNTIREVKINRKEYECVVYLEKQNKSLARKIMQDMVAQYEAEKEGL